MRSITQDVGDVATEERSADTGGVAEGEESVLRAIKGCPFMVDTPTWSG